MAISYNLLWKKLIDMDMTKTDLMKKAKLNSATMANIGKNKYISMGSLDKICCALNCDYGDIMEYVAEDTVGVVNDD